jgi:hypothetical protein
VSITVNKIKGTDGIVIIIDSAESAANFKTLVHRATNLWPDAVPEIKEFADQITNADWLPENKKSLQDYKSQDTSGKKKCIHQRTKSINPFDNQWHDSIQCRDCGLTFKIIPSES